MKRLKIALIAGLLIVPIAAAQLKVDVQLVDVVATVTDDRGHYVSDLTADDFIVKEDGQTQAIAHVTQSTDLPVSVGLVLDSSGSMARRIDTATNAVERFIRTIHKDDDIFLMTFSTRPNLVQDFTANRDRLASALRRVTVFGETALYDALEESLKHLRGGRHVKKAILLITDGQDTASYINVDEASRDVRESEMLVYSLGIQAGDSAPFSTGTGPSRVPSTPPVIVPDPTGRRVPTITLPGTNIPINIPGGRGKLPLVEPSQRQRLPGGTTVTVSDGVDMNVLDAFADASGGKAWLLSPSWTNNRGSEINAILDEIASELRSQYSIDYYPAHPINDGKWHRIEVVAKNKNYHVRARKEYFGR